jgi:hypothetical protein
MRQLVSLIFRKRNRRGTVIVIGKLHNSEFVAKVNGGIVARSISRIGRVVKIFVICVVAHSAASPLKIR